MNKLFRKIYKIPAFIDVHQHTRANEPGEITITEAINTAIHAGVGATMIMGNFKNYPLINAENINKYIRQLNEVPAVRSGEFEAKICKVATPDNFAELYKSHYTIATKFYLGNTTNSGGLVLNRAAWRKHLFAANTRIAVHAELDELDDFLDDMLQLSRMKRVHICHVPGRRELESIMRARKKLAASGLDNYLTCEVTPHHLFIGKDGDKYKFHNNVLPQLNINVCPPIRSIADCEFLQNNIDQIDCIATDKAPHRAQSNAPGIEYTHYMQLMLDAVYRGKISLNDVIKKCIVMPQILFGFRDTKLLTVSFSRDVILPLKTAAPNSPYYGISINGKILNNGE